MRRLLLSLTLGVALLGTGGSVPAGAASFPSIIDLPGGWGPEGIAIRAGTDEVYVGSIPTGAIWKGDLRSGEGEVLVAGVEGRAAIGIKVDRERRIFVAGGPTGKAFVYDARDGDLLAEYTLAPAGQSFVNDVVVTRDAAYFTDSRSAALGVVPLDGDDLPAQAAVRSLPLTGDFVPVSGPDAFNLNGITATRKGKHLVAVQSATGKLFHIDPRTGVTDEIEVEGGPFPNGDGLWLHGRRLYVVQNRLNQVAVVQLTQDLASGRLLRTLTDPALQVPTTIARSGSRYYVVNARFGTPVTPQTEYAIVKLPGG